MRSRLFTLVLLATLSGCAAHRGTPSVPHGTWSPGGLSVYMADTTIVDVRFPENDQVFMGAEIANGRYLVLSPEARGTNPPAHDAYIQVVTIDGAVRILHLGRSDASEEATLRVSHGRAVHFGVPDSISHVFLGRLADPARVDISVESPRMLRLEAMPSAPAEADLLLFLRHEGQIYLRKYRLAINPAQ